MGLGGGGYEDYLLVDFMDLLEKFLVLVGKTFFVF